MPDSMVFAFFNTYPVLPLLVIVTNLVAFLPIASLLYIAQSAPLHNNCRYIISMWSASFGVVYLLNIGFSILDMKNDTGFMPLSMYEPHVRFQMYRVHIMCTTFCSLFEIALSIERIVAIIRPRRYHFSDTVWGILLPLTGIIMIIAYSVDMGVHSETRLFRNIGLSALALIELSILTVCSFFIFLCRFLQTAGIAMKACLFRYARPFGKTSLPVRYQVKEAYEMSKAMIPAYGMSFLLKVIVFHECIKPGIELSIIAALTVFLSLKEEHGNTLGYLEAYYFVINAVNGSFAIVILLLKHPQLRKHSLRKFRAYFYGGLKPLPKKSSITHTADTAIHFTMLAEYWK